MQKRLPHFQSVVTVGICYSLPRGTFTASIGSVQELLHLLLVLDTLLEHEPSPVDGEDPADQVDRCEHLNDPNSKLSLAVLLGVSDAGADHSSDSGEDDIENEAEVRPDAGQTGNGGDQVPKFGILGTILSHSALSILEAGLGELASLILIGSSSIVLLGLGQVLDSAGVRCSGSCTLEIVLCHYYLFLKIKIQIIIN